eukprot:g944.t1
MTSNTANSTRTATLPFVKVSDLAPLKPTNSRVHTVVQGRYISIIRGIHNKLYAIDSVCYHMGGPLTIGDIEDVNGKECVRCPWHHYPVVLEDGSKLYQAMEFKGGKLQPAGWKASTNRQRVHDVEERGDGIYVRLTSLEDVGRQCTNGEYESDRWAFNEDAAMNCLRPGSNSGADGKATGSKFKSSDGVHHSKLSNNSMDSSTSGKSSGYNQGSIHRPFKRSGEVLAAQRRKATSNYNNNSLNSSNVNYQKKVYHVMTPNEFLPFYLLNKKQIANTMFIYTFLLDPSHSLGIKTVERHLQVRGKLPSSNEVVIREYTPVSHNKVKGKFDLAVKLYPNGKMSKIFANLKNGDSIEMRGPFGDVSIEMPEFENIAKIGRGPNFKTNFNEMKNISMVAGGSGITPMLQILKSDAAQVSDVQFCLLFANRTLGDVSFFKDLMHLSQNNKNISIYFYLSQGPLPSAPIAGCNIEIGRIGEKHLREVIFPPRKDSALLICGPEEFETSMCAIGEYIGFLKNNIYVF